MSEIEDILTRASEAGIEDIRNQMVATNTIATGRGFESLRYEITGGNTSTIYGAHYIFYLVHGRGPGGMPPVENIRVWAEAKGLPEGIEWGIAKKIAKEGTDIFQGIRPGLNPDETIEAIRGVITAQVRAGMVDRVKARIVSRLGRTGR